MEHKTLSVENSAASESVAIYDAAEISRLPETPQIDTHPVQDDIANLRSRLPFVAFLPFPRASFVVQLAQNITGEIRIPDNAVGMKLCASADLGFFFTDKGAASGNTSAQEALVGNNQFSADVFATRETDWLYCAQMRTVSVRNPNQATIYIGARFIFRDEI